VAPSSSALSDRRSDRPSERPGDPIVVTGIGAVSALGTGRGETWRAFSAGESGVRELGEDDPRRARGVDPTPLPDVGRAGWVRGFDPRAHIQGAHLRRMDWCSRLLVAATRLAGEDAGALPIVESESAAIVVGSCYGNQRETATYLDRVFAAGLGAGQPILFPNLVLNAAAGYAAIELGIQGANLTLAEHEVSGEAAIATAADLLRSGACDLVFAGGVDEFGAVLLDALAERRTLAPESLPEARRARAIRARRGLAGRITPGEGAAVLVLERAASALGRGARIYAALSGAAVRALPAAPYSIAQHATAAAEELLALASVGGDAAPVSAVLGSSDGSRQRAAVDAALVEALRRRQPGPVSYAAFRASTGDFGGAGALGAALAALVVDAGFLPAAAFGGAGQARVAAQRVLVAGVGRSGVLAPLVVERFDAGA
jgi:3-oxoacyl-[acyl-carrier-protein] synthase II